MGQILLTQLNPRQVDRLFVQARGREQIAIPPLELLGIVAGVVSVAVQLVHRLSIVGEDTDTEIG